VRFTVFCVYYEVSDRKYPALPQRDPGFFLGLLWESGRWGHPIGEVVSVDQMLDRDWAIEHARWFVEHVEQTAVRNDPPTAEGWGHLHDFNNERDGGWLGEEWFAQADYLVRVTDRCWIQHLNPGDAWGTTWFPMDADNPRAADLPHVPNVHAPTVLEDRKASRPHRLAFSDDSQFLAVFRDKELVIYDCADWSEHFRVEPAEADLMWKLKWVPGRHVVALADVAALEVRQEAYDVDARAKVDVPVQQGCARSRTGRYRIDFGWNENVTFYVDNGDPIDVSFGDDEYVVEHAAFTEDESRLFVAGMQSAVDVIDPAARVAVDTIPGDGFRVNGVALSPCAAYLVTAEQINENVWGPEGEELRIRRLTDGEIFMRHRPKAYVSCLEWSPDGRWLALGAEHQNGGGETRVMPVGLPAEPPEDLRPPASATGQRA
jgi:hypothetical protein